jgi:hypothetical protein
MNEPVDNQESSKRGPAINPKHRVYVDGDLTEARLIYLINLNTEEDRLDYKTEFNFAGNTKDRIELVRDVVGMANTDGGYIVLGVREITNGTAKRYEPEGLTSEQCNALDISKLRQQVESFISERLNIQLQIHSLSEFDDKQFALIYIPPSPHKPIIIERDGTHMNASTGKNETLFRSGDILVRKGASTSRGDQSDMRRLFSEIRQREKSQWTEEILDIHSLVQRLDKLINLLSGSITSSTEEPDQLNVRSEAVHYDETLFYLAPEVIQSKIIDLLEKQKLISINRYIQNAHNLFYQYISDNQPIDPNELTEIKDNYLLPILDSLTSMGVVFIEYQQWELISAIQKAFYLLCRRAEKSQNTLPLRKTWLWQEVMIRVYALGALLVDRAHWEQAKALIEQEVEWDDFYRKSYWSRYFLIMVSRANHLKENGWVLATIRYIESNSWLSSLFMSDKDEITNAAIGFDFLQCVYMLVYPSDDNHAWPFPSFAMFPQTRIEPILLKLITKGRLRDTLHDVTDERLAEVIRAILEYATQVPGHDFGWGSYWYNKQIQRFMDEHKTKS